MIYIYVVVMNSFLPIISLIEFKKVFYIFYRKKRFQLIVNSISIPSLVYSVSYYEVSPSHSTFT